MASTDKYRVRKFKKEDATQLLSLMRELAEFEGYLDKFRVSEEAIVAHGLETGALFSAFVGVNLDTNQLDGMAVTYVLPWTYDLRPTLILKELFVVETARGSGLGSALMHHVAEHATKLGATRVQWTVLQENNKAAEFYRQMGGEQDHKWQNWCLVLENYQNPEPTT